MQITFHVEREPAKDRWRVRRGTSKLSNFEDQARAVTAAENFAREAAQSGENALVSIENGDSPRVVRRFAAGQRPLTPYL